MTPLLKDCTVKSSHRCRQNVAARTSNLQMFGDERYFAPHRQVTLPWEVRSTAEHHTPHCFSNLWKEDIKDIWLLWSKGPQWLCQSQIQARRTSKISGLPGTYLNQPSNTVRTSTGKISEKTLNKVAYQGHNRTALRKYLPSGHQPSDNLESTNGRIDRTLHRHVFHTEQSD
jgi:hypothetical protein